MHRPLATVETIQTQHCWLAPLKASDRHDVAALYRHEEVRRHLGGPVKGNPFDERFAALLDGGDIRAWVVREAKGGGFVGLITLARHHDGEDLEVSYQLLPAFWGRGLAAETVGAVIRYALTDLALPRVIAETQAANHRSRRLLERLGMATTRTVVGFGAPQVIYEWARR
jgi:ribosomal-protein-alanine N-acetyltransferase